MPPHARLALSVIERAVKDIEHGDASLHRSAARFLKGSEDFYFWARALDQDSDWLLRALHVRLHHDSPRAYERLAPPPWAETAALYRPTTVADRTGEKWLPVTDTGEVDHPEPIASLGFHSSQRSGMGLASLLRRGLEVVCRRNASGTPSEKLATLPV